MSFHDILVFIQSHLLIILITIAGIAITTKIVNLVFKVVMLLIVFFLFGRYGLGLF